MYSSNDMYELQAAQSSAEFPYSFPGCPARDLDTRDITAEVGEVSQHRSTIPGMSKMQTIQSLSKFDNPMRNLAQSRLQQFSVTSPTDPGRAVEALLRDKASASSAAASRGPEFGELNRGYQFPSRPQGLSGSSSVQSNPLYGVFSPSTPTKGGPPARGPQPLTAGPPGQRSYPSLPRFGANSIDSLWSNDPLSYSQGPPQNSYGYTSTAAYISEYPAVELNPGPAVPRTRIVDTLDPVTAAKYYPNGRVPDVYKPLGMIEQMEMDRGRKLTQVEKVALNFQKIIYDNYEGQRRFAMTFEDYDDELRQRQMSVDLGKNQVGPVQHSSREKSFESITVEEMNSMPLAEAARPIFQAAYGSLLRYVGPGIVSDKLKSGYKDSAEHLLDRSEEGNKSFFGEDWGRPKAQVIGHDPRLGTCGPDGQ